MAWSIAGVAGGRSANVRSAAVTTASTPGMERASATSMWRSRAWAMVERT